MPPIPSLIASLRHLTILGALDVEKRSNLDNLLALRVSDDFTKINELGTLLSKLPLSPKFSKMLVVSRKYNILRFVIMIVACLSVSELFKEIPLAELDLPEEAVDEDLTTAFDRQKLDKKRKRMEKEAAHERMKLLREQRSTW
jgi:ATP-dependent RNA helicase DHX37/DHR1